MGANRIICRCQNIDYLSIRKSMIMGARSLEDIQGSTHACRGCCDCQEDIQNILSSVCSCKNVSVQEVVDVVKAGATSVEEVADLTGAGSDCQRCRLLVKDIITRGY